MIQVESLTKFYGAKRALNDLSFRVGSGEIIGLVGKNGAGKSTVLKILSAQLHPSGGSVFIDGIPVAEQPRAVRGRIGYLPEVAPLYKEMTVRDYLDFAGRLRQINRAEMAGHLSTAVGDTGLAEVIDERLGDLSRGFQQRVGIAQAIIHRPPVILLDEPMGGLDPLQIIHIRDLILNLGKQHTVLFSSHILSEITNVCDRVILIDEGAVKAEGSEEELRSSLKPWRELSLLVRGEEKSLTRLLEGIEGLSIIETSSREGGLAQARFSCRGDLREEVSRSCIEAGMGLLEITGGHHGLEELFLQLVEKGGPEPS